MGPSGLGATTGAGPAGTPSERRFRFELAAHPGSPAQARRLTRARLTGWSVCEDTCDTAALVVSELVTNAIVHTASATVVCELHDSDDLVRIAVRDEGCAPGEPHPSPSRPEEEHGRGLLLVDALCRAWGALEHGPGLLVWAELTRGTATQDTGLTVPEDDSVPGQGSAPGHFAPPGHGSVPGHGSPPGHGTTPARSSVPGHGATPGHGSPPARSTTPARSSVPGHGTTPAHSTIPGHGTSPEHAPRPTSPPGNALSPRDDLGWGARPKPGESGDSGDEDEGNPAACQRTGPQSPAHQWTGAQPITHHPTRQPLLPGIPPHRQRPEGHRP